MRNSGITSSQDIRALSDDELDRIVGGLDIGPIHVEPGSGLLTIGIGGYGIWAGQGCVGVYTPNSVKGVCAA